MINYTVRHIFFSLPQQISCGFHFLCVCVIFSFEFSKLNYPIVPFYSRTLILIFNISGPVVDCVFFSISKIHWWVIMFFDVWKLTRAENMISIYLLIQSEKPINSIPSVPSSRWRWRCSMVMMILCNMDLTRCFFDFQLLASHNISPAFLVGPLRNIQFQENNWKIQLSFQPKNIHIIARLNHSSINCVCFFFSSIC